MSDREDQEPRLPPGQYLTRAFPVSHLGSVPYFDPHTWDLTVTGLVELPLRFDHERFLALPRKEVVADLHCVTTWSTFGLRWGGVPFAELVRLARPLPEARFVLVHADGGYSTSLELPDLLEDDVLVADRLGDGPLPPEHGHPARLVVPRKYRYKSAKWVRRFEFLAEDHPGSWESRGYSNLADPWTEDRFAITSTGRDCPPA